VPLDSLIRPCDRLVLALDVCPILYFGRKPARDALLNHKPCTLSAVQISFMAAAPGLPFFRCALMRAVHNVESEWYGPSDLFTTGPSLAGECLDKLHLGMDYTMEIVQVCPVHARDGSNRQ
jgi:hypothetical protein